MPDSSILRSSIGELDGPEILVRPTKDLLGVSEPAAKALGDLGIKTVFDLGASNVFASARAVVDFSKAGANRFGLVAGDLLNDPNAVALPPDELDDQPLTSLRGLTEEQAKALQQSLDVATISDLANWPPHREARQLIGEAVGSTNDPEDQQAEELRPRFGQFPTERVYYSTLVMMEMLGEDPPLEDLTGPISLNPAVQQPAGITRPAVGALLSFEQSWFAQGVTLGHMLHSLSLAPGEATRVAVVDWSRKTSAFASESIGESEQIDSATNHARALSEVQQAVASDFQQGGSSSSSSSTSSSEASQSTGSSGLLESLFSSGSGSDASQSATTTGEAESASWSIGNRSVMGSLTQNVNDRTEQHSSSVRNRRATAVREVSQSEHENVSTRIVANYNHMHALNMQYYEVVQIYRTEARLHRADRCLFVPMEMLDFSGAAGFSVVERFRGALLRAALNNRIRALLADDTTAVEISPTRPVHFPGFRPDLLGVSILTAPAVFHAAVVSPAARLRTSRALSALTDIGGAAAARPVIDTGGGATTGGGGGGGGGTGGGGGGGGTGGGGTTTTPVGDPVLGGSVLPGVRLWDTDAIARVARFIDRSPIRPDSESLFVPDDTELIGISFDQVAIKTVRIDHVGGAAADDQTFTIPPEIGRIDLTPGVRFVELDALIVTKTADAAASGSMTLHCSYLGRRFTLPAIPLDLVAGTAPQKVVGFTTDQADRRRELQQHLQANRDYYSQAIFRSLDAATLTFILGKFRLNGRPLIDQVEPRPLTIAGNYIVLRAPVEDDEPSGIAVDGQQVAWNDLLKRRGLDKSAAFDRRLIPIPTGGVFAEAVLGRSNSAEKLDITRFWHWEDSPIPIVPTEIAPVQTGTRATPEDLTPGQLSQPVLSLVNPTALPDPTGMAAILTALATLNFRDQSGLAGTQGEVKAGEQGTLDAATAAGKIASDNLKTEAQKAVQMGQIAADVAKSAIAANVSKAQAAAGKGGAGGGLSGISRDGALVNEGKKLDDAKASAGSGPAGGTSTNGSAPSVPSTDLQTVLAGGGSGGSSEGDAFKTALFGPLGASGLDAANIILAKTEPTGTGSGSGTGTGGASATMSPFPGSPIATILTADSKLDQAFADAKAIAKADTQFTTVTGLPNLDDLPITIVALNPDGSRPHTGQHETDMYYSGSMAKVAAMYAAYQLRSAVNEFAATLGAGISEDDLFKALEKTFDPQIRSAVPVIERNIGNIAEQIGGKTVFEDLRLPKYRRLFIATKGATQFTVDFRVNSSDFDGNFFGHMREMIVNSDNALAGVTIRWVGYGTINGALKNAGFFDPTNQKGIWLAGDYNNAPTVNIQSVNDRDVKQVTNTFQTARWLTALHDDVLIKNTVTNGVPSDTARGEMLSLMGLAVDGHAPSIMKGDLPSPAPFDVLNTKIGVGTLKFDGVKASSCNHDSAGNTHNCVTAEIALVQQRADPKRKFVVCWQGVLDTDNRRDADIKRINQVIANVMDKYRP